MFKINWNGDKTGRETIRVLNSTNSQIYIVKVADCVLFDFGATLEDILAELESGSLKIAAWVNQKLNGILSASQQEQMLQRNSDGTCVGGNIVFEINSESIRVYQDNVNVANLLIVINEDGIWFRHSTHHMTYNDTTIDMEGFVYGVSFDAYPGGETINEMFVSPGVNIQSDWNQNDVSALDYVKNRTHWSEKSIRAVCSGTFEGNYYDIGIDNIQNMPHPGDTCHVVFDSIEYDCVAFDEQIEGAYATCIGNKLYINNSPDGSGEPFVLVLDVENGLAWINCDSGTHTFSIEMIHEEVHQLDPKYIKDMYYEEYVESTITNNINVTLEGTEPVLNPFSIEIIEGDIYTVTWDGATYECTAYIAEGPNTPSIGNGFIANASGGVNEPFFITVYDGDVMLFGSETGTHTISITTMVPEIHTLDNKYLDFIDIQETQIIIPKQEITTKPSTYIGYNYCIDDKSANDFIDGVEYIVTMDEIEYKCIASVFNADDYSFLILGNTNLQHITNFQGHGNGEPFCLYSAFARDGVLYFVTENASTHTIEVRIDGNCKIKESYLPLSQSDWNQSDKTSGTYIKNRPFYTEKGTYIPHETSGSVKNYEIIWTFYPQSYDGLVKVVNDNGLNASDFIGATILKGNAYLDDFIINESDIDESGNIVAIDENRLFVFVKEGSVVTWTNPSG